ncbi:MAG: hypothetical protein FWC82_00915 [Firmicutes bacterium]|nr:hypothetical protein [Bacillota bacterium]
MKTLKCKNCAHYTAYYKKWICNFERLSNGFCEKHQKLQTQHETCDDFKSSEQKEEGKKRKLLSSLEQAVDSINVIAQILKDDYLNDL